MVRLISADARISKRANLEHPVRVFSFVNVQRGAQIGRYTYVNSNSFIGGNARIGRYCSIGRSVEIGVTDSPDGMLSTHPFQYTKLYFSGVPEYADWDRDFTMEVLETKIGHDVSIGSKSIVPSGVSVGTGAIIKQDSHVDRDVEPYAIVAGSPAIVVGYRFPAETISRLIRSNWWDLAPHEMQGLKFDDVELALDQLVEAQKEKKIEVSGHDVDLNDSTRTKGAVVAALEQSLIDLGSPPLIVELVLSDHSRIEQVYDLDDPIDQHTLQSKLRYLVTFLKNNNVDSLTANERSHLRNLFR